jgi:hypothetical protein
MQIMQFIHAYAKHTIATNRARQTTGATSWIHCKSSKSMAAQATEYSMQCRVWTSIIYNLI